MIRSAQARDAAALAVIYNHYVCNTTVTFEESPVTAEEMTRRLQAVQASGLPWLVTELDGKVLGYAYATKWKERSAYRFSAECTIYLERTMHGRGLGKSLYRELLAVLADLGVHAVIGGIAQPNLASVGLHEKLGFRNVALFREVGRKFDAWIDVGYWQRILDGDLKDIRG
ncbi:arsinothricin resistance N-acetyltransferase ArsN1 family B [Massilia horti]|uniref:N-acetyltransferase family protein n=1 Tax=Massilia horti TaxID=2562153 RepID=A0A4Y9T2V8_9BURK|nr:arsinothricin resistance N-acetyltransferase ArsN1 family B [Massilia horti]TFW34021.1 N-acetyltransferase family protein [Massilia horti]